MKLGFFGGSFNPPTIAHYNLIKEALEKYEFDKVFFVPVNDYYKKNGLARLEDRIKMLELLIKNDEQIYIYKIENDKSYKAIDTFRNIKKHFQTDEIVFFMGEDNFEKMPRWQNYEELKQYNYIVFQRNDKYDANINQKNVIYMKNNENIEVSSTMIRNKLEKKESISELINKDVEKYIKEKGLYLKDI